MISQNIQPIIIPDKNSINNNKIFENFYDFRKKIHEVLETNKHILYLPWSYDLVHIWHESFIDQAKSFYIQSHNDTKKNKISSDDVIVVICIDSDELIQKNKWNGYKKVFDEINETSSIPIQSWINNDLYYSRLESLSKLNVDILWSTPNEIIIKDWKKEFEKIQKLLSLMDISKDINKYLLWKLEDIYSWINFVDWNVESQQYMIITKLFWWSKNVTRIISADDIDYIDIVWPIMKLSWINYEIIEDKHVVSTKSLILQNGISELKLLLKK